MADKKKSMVVKKESASYKKSMKPEKEIVEFKKKNAVELKQEMESQVESIESQRENVEPQRNLNLAWNGEWKREYLIYGSILLILGFLSEYLINRYYSPGSFISALYALIGIGTLFYFWNKGHYNFLLAVLVGAGFFSALSVSFNLGFIINYLFAALIMLLFGMLYGRFRSKTSYALLLLVAFAGIFGILGANVTDKGTWLVESSMTVPFVFLIVIGSLWFRFSKLSYSLFFLFLFLHVIGVHYSYTLVPLANIIAPLFGTTAENYDIIMHFFYGLLMIYPIREAYIKTSKGKGVWTFAVPMILLFGFGMIYEILLMVASRVFAATFLAQGAWESQIEMLYSGIGAAITIIITFITLLIMKDEVYWDEFKKSFDMTA